jgi:hypothetical protein
MTTPVSDPEADDDLLLLGDADAPNGLRTKHVLADCDAPLILEIGGGRYVRRADWSAFLQWKEANAYYRQVFGRDMPDTRPIRSDALPRLDTETEELIHQLAMRATSLDAA